MITELHDKLINNSDYKNELIKKTLENAQDNQKKYNAFVTIMEDRETKITANLLSGIPYALKDNFATKGILTTGSSNTLKNYTPVFDATIYDKLNQAGAVCIGKTVLDELGMGSTGTTGHTGIVKNPWNTEHICGGSSAGSAAVVASGLVYFAIGSDTGDSVRKPAALTGIVGYKPTYGLVSRYGLFAFASSLDTVGVLTRSVKDAAIVINEIKGIDSKDMTTYDSKDIDLLKNINNDLKNKKLFYIKELCNIEYYSNPSKELIATLNTFKETINKIKNTGIEIKEERINLNILKAIYPTYVTISCAEATSNYSNLTGIIFGERGVGKNINEVIKDHRTKGFSTLIKRRFIIGSYVLQKENQERYYINALKARRLIVATINKFFTEYDGLILPANLPARKISETNEILSSEMTILENHLAIANFGGYPSITIPSGFVNNLPIAINITGKIKDDGNILNIANKIEEILPYKNQTAGEEN